MSSIPKASLIGTILFPGRSSLLPASTLPEMPATFFPSINWPGGQYATATSDLNYLLENHELKPGTEGQYNLGYTPEYNQPYNTSPNMYEQYPITTFFPNYNTSNLGAGKYLI